MDRLPDDKSLNIKKTFESQQKKVNNIIPVVQKSINKKFFPVTDGIIKHVIHERHRHQQEELLNARRGANWKRERRSKIIDKLTTLKDRLKRERRSKIIDKLTTLKDRLKRERRSKIIDKLTTLKDRLVDKFYDDELRPVRTENRYHSLEESETDEDNPNKRKIVIRDLKWRSSSVSIRVIFTNRAASSKSRRVRNREYSNYATNKIDAPINALRWTKDGYNGSLKQLIEKYSKNKCSPPEEADENQDPPEEDDQAGEDENQEVVDENQEEVDENQEEIEVNQEDEEENQKDEEEDQNKNKRGVSVVSSEYDSISSE
ncbi:hypothetical protein RirG_257140 [Rhizophagus irregularis DAOM 197198w]|uniref:Uncharacterized protein n=1 Tax=Rhizophagus irregularis (strain DAOM 197198w) TaxID=1432141 RepID=A0A015IDH9_RHIIW|nr:hypothetical protein RirG_257140 [Rhizophagus irregularis DAOM 197198w]